MREEKKRSFLPGAGTRAVLLGVRVPDRSETHGFRMLRLEKLEDEDERRENTRKP